MELAVIGAGPCGIAVGASARRVDVDAILFDRGPVTSSLIGYPYYMTFFSTAAKLEVGGVPFTIPESNPTRRQALTYYRRVVEHWDLDVRQYHDVVSVTGSAGDFRLRVRRRDGSEAEVGAQAVVVAIGGFHQPNWLGVPGDDLDKVHHYYTEPYPYYDQDVLVVGGRNSAVESALELYRNGTRVSMVHFELTLDSGVKPWVVPDITNRLKTGEIPSWFETRIKEILPASVVLQHERTGETTEIANDWVLAMTGWRRDPDLLASLGVQVDEDTGIPEHNRETMETNVEGIYLAGVIAAGHNANKIFIENGRHHGDQIVEAFRGMQAGKG